MGGATARVGEGLASHLQEPAFLNLLVGLGKKFDRGCRFIVDYLGRLVHTRTRICETN